MIVRLLGLALMLYAALIDMGRNPALIPAATALIFGPTVVNGRR